MLYNEDQFKHSLLVEKVFDNMKRNLDHNNLAKAKVNLEAGMKLISKRKKLIRLAERDEGMKMVGE